MKLLLDTHVLIWLACDAGQLPAHILEQCQSEENRVYLSVVSNWEIQIKAQLGKLALPVPRRELISRAENEGIEKLSILDQHIDALDELDPTHRDPFDRLLMAQALSQGLTLVSADQKIQRYSGQIEILWS